MSDQTDPAFLQGGYPGISKIFVQIWLDYMYNSTEIGHFFP